MSLSKCDQLMKVSWWRNKNFNFWWKVRHTDPRWSLIESLLLRQGKKIPIIRNITRLFLSSLLSVWRYKWFLQAFSVVPKQDCWAGPAGSWLTSRCGCSGTGMTPRIILFVFLWNEVELFQTLPGPAWALDTWWWLCFVCEKEQRISRRNAVMHLLGLDSLC